ncbi:hypothetical protein SAMN02990966_05715 [Rhodospirillales bacterium URHD0017]|nr:hypothetical protein SAMN02990966_05715 [Rhodospirillales bacterium URHD0017]
MRRLWPVVAAVGLVAATAQAQDPAKEWALPASGLLHGSKATIETQPCCGPSRNARVNNPDSAALAKWSGAAARDGRTLLLKLAGNRTLKLTDCDDQSGCEADGTRVHRLVDWWPQHRLYVVLVGLYEESAAYLVSERDGRTLVATAPPVLSPSGRQAVALVSNLMSGVDLEIIDLSRNPPTATKVTAMPDCSGAGPNSFLRPIPVWTDETHVTFEGESPLPEDKPNTKQLLRVEGGKGQWQC